MTMNATSNAIAIAADHAGIDLKAALVEELRARGHEVSDLGAHDRNSVDYPAMADTLAHALLAGPATRGVLICGTGVGIGIAANRHRHLRAALCHDVTTARLAREHNDANVLVLGARTSGTATALDCLRTFLDTEFEGGRHARRVAMLSGG